MAVNSSERTGKEGGPCTWGSVLTLWGFMMVMRGSSVYVPQSGIMPTRQISWWESVIAMGEKADEIFCKLGFQLTSKLQSQSQQIGSGET